MDQGKDRETCKVHYVMAIPEQGIDRERNSSLRHVTVRFSVWIECQWEVFALISAETLSLHLPAPIA